MGEPTQSGAPGGWRPFTSEQRNPLAAAHQQRAKRERQHGSAIASSLIRELRFEPHRGRTVAPEPHRLRRFPFALAHKQVLRLRRLPPIDGGGGIFRRIAAELPEAFAHPGFAPSVHAKS